MSEASERAAAHLALLDAPDDPTTESKGPSLAASIETQRFLGREFLAWLWFESELFEQTFSIPAKGFESCALWLEHSIVLDCRTEAGREKASLAGVAPSGGSEARDAMRQGKTPARAKIAIKVDEQDYAFVFDAETMGMSAVKIPALLRGEGDDPFHERIHLVEALEHAVETLFGQFLKLRVTEAWSKIVVRGMRGWMNDDETPAVQFYRTMRARPARAEQVKD